MKPSGVLRFALAAALLAITAILLQARSGEKVPVDAACTSASDTMHARGSTEILRLPFSCFPQQLANWDSSEIVLDKDTLEKLGPGDFKDREYQDPDGNLPYVNLLLEYFSSQRAGDTMHSPQNCLPGAGWNPEENDRVTLSLPAHAPFPVNRYVVSKAGAHDLVLYWFWAHDRGVASEYLAKYYLVKDAIRMNRSDGGMVRFVTPMFPGETPAAAQQRILPFTSAVVPLLDDYIPR
jgi:EpsI family protein